MSHAQSFEAIVLKTYDVGEADRFCILFTRERGRIAARASGARRLQSRLGAALLPFQSLTVDLKEGSSGWIIAGAQGLRHSHRWTVAQFTALEEGIELLLRLVTDEGAIPDVFDATRSFVSACADSAPHASLAYSFALLHMLGFLPAGEELQSLQSLRPSGHAFLDACRAGSLVEHCGDDHDRLSALRSMLLDNQLSSPLHVQRVAEAMR